MKIRFLLPFLLLAAEFWAQAPGTPSVTVDVDLPPETVVATVDGQQVTFGDLQAVLRSLPAQNQQAALKDRRKFVEQYGLLKRLTQLAEKDKLDQKSPYKEALAYQRMQVLSQAELNEKYVNIPVAPEDQKKFYDENKDRYTQAQVKVIYIPFSATPPPQTDPKAKKVLSEAEARAKAEGLLKQIRGGTDFIKLVKEHSEDTTSAAKDGDFGTIRKSDKIPDSIKNVIFALKSGEVSEPVRQPNGFYLFRVEQLSEEPYEKVKDAIFSELKNERLREWLNATQTGIEIKVENQAFFSPQTTPLAVPAPPQPGPAKPPIAPAK
jgi:parvulin-like peptidyl-prolyl isomerase